PVRGRPARVDDAFGNALVVEMRDLFAEDEVLKQRRTTKTGLERALIVADRHALIRRKRAVGRVHAHAIKWTDRWVLANVRPTAADLVGSIQFGNGAGTGNRIRRLHGRAFRRRERRGGIVFGGLVRVERESGGDILCRSSLLRRDIAET